MEAVAAGSSLGFFATFWNSESDMSSESESEEWIRALDLTLSVSLIFLLLAVVFLVQRSEWTVSLKRKYTIVFLQYNGCQQLFNLE